MCGRLRLPSRHIGMLCLDAAVGLFSSAIRSEAASVRLGRRPGAAADITHRSGLADPSMASAEPLVPTATYEIFEIFSNHGSELEPRYGIEP